MIKTTTKQLAKNAAINWRGNYFRNGRWIYDDDKEEIYKKLLALGGDPTIQQVNSAIGNNSWTSLTCNECSKNVSEVVQVGAPSDYDSATADLCVDCIKKALELIDKQSDI